VTVRVIPPLSSDLDTAVADSLVRLLTTAPLHNRGPLFAMLARIAARHAADELWWLADQLELPDIIGATLINDILDQTTLGGMS
jgi:hypothetical protein